MLTRLASHLENVQSLKKKVVRASVYPIVVILIGLVVSAFMLLFIVPQFETLFSSHGADLPGFTKAVIGLSRIVQSYWFIILLLLAVLIFSFKYFRKKSEAFSHSVDRIILKIPIFGDLQKKVIFARFTRTLAITLDSGMLIVDALYLIGDIIKNSVYKNAISQIREDVTAGVSMFTAMQKTHLFPNMITQMVEVGEKTGEMKEILTKTADYYEEEVDLVVSNMSTILEPFTIVILGGMVAVLVIAMYLPIFKIGSVF